MTPQEIQKLKNEVISSLGSLRLHDAFAALRKLVDETSHWEVKQDFDQLNTSFHYMLQYLSQGVLDPKRGEVQDSLVDRLYALLDRVEIALSQPVSYDLFYSRRRSQDLLTIQRIVQMLTAETERYALVSDTDDTSMANSVLVEREKIETQLFNKLWTMYPMNSSDSQTIVEQVFVSQQMPNYVKSLVVSALLLGMTKFYDEVKLMTLFEAYRQCDDVDVRMRAFAAAVIAMYLHRHRVVYSTAVRNLFDTLSDDPNFHSDLSMTYMQLVRSRNTENISRRVQENLIKPTMGKITPDLINKIKEIGAEMPTDIEANPEWQEWLEQSGLRRQMEELNEIQFEGGDLLMSTFSRLKSFPFFQTLSNWFLPFHEVHTALIDLQTDGNNEVASLISSLPFMCDSDKFSLALSLCRAGTAEREMMFSQFRANKEGLEEMKSDSESDPLRQREACLNNYIKDLYRFFKLFSRRNEFASVFDLDMNLLKVPIIAEHIDDVQTLQVIAEFYSKNRFYNDAVSYYDHLLKSGEDIHPNVLQKMGFAHQNLGHLNEAIKYYKRYELVNEDNDWNLRQIAACYRQKKDYARALEYFRRAEALQTDNLALCLNIGHCLLETGEYEAALKQYFKADYLDNGQHKAWRPIAWTSFLLGDFEQSEKYYHKILDEDTPDATDLLNYGHLLLVTDRLADAVTYYSRSLEMMNDDEKFRKVFAADSRHLKKLGANSADLPIIVEAAIFKAKEL